MSRTAALLLTASVSAALLAQTAPGLEPDFFMKDPKTIMVVCADKARAARPDDSRMLAQFGGIYLAAGLRDRALEAFTRAGRLGGADSTTQSLIAEAWLAQGAKTEALDAADRATDLTPRNKALLAQLGIGFMDAGFATEGDRFMRRAYAVDPTDLEMTLNFGRACLRAKHPEHAAEWFRYALSGRMEDGKVFTAIGVAYANQGARP
jgi:tetratricopeptide (TPR) repeat protein